LHHCNWIQFGEGAKKNAPRRLRFNAMYVGFPCDIVSEAKTLDFAFVATLHRSPKRGALCEWISSSARRYSMEFCGKGAQCPTLARAKLGFHVQGDSISSQRPFDTLLSGSIPVFTEQVQYAVTQSWIDWDKISYFADLTNKGKFLADLDRILQDTELLEEKRQNVLANRRLFDWDTLVPFDTYMYMLQAYLFPQHRHNSSVYSALLID
jgi:hypothetical protein